MDRFDLIKRREKGDLVIEYWEVVGSSGTCYLKVMLNKNEVSGIEALSPRMLMEDQKAEIG